MSRAHLTVAVAALLSATAALPGPAAGAVLRAAGTGAPTALPLLALAATLCCAAWLDRWAGTGDVPAREPGDRGITRFPPTARHIPDRCARLAVLLAVHPLLALALLPLCRTVPATPVPALAGPDADAARALRRIVRTATEQDARDTASAVPLNRLLLRHHTRFSARVARATERSARRTALTGLRGRLPYLYALVLAVPGTALAGAGAAGSSATAPAVCVFLTVVTTPLTGGSRYE
ncbi:hypothetical protein ACIBCM_08680 [Streptomyces sp. NPDC051018]|uniref:hypothetical protein n=1 Tax=Streptomyces sp. NPDC051018 TaxID=3365639 RepID=UPI00378AC93A